MSFSLGSNSEGHCAVEWALEMFRVMSRRILLYSGEKINATTVNDDWLFRLRLCACAARLYKASCSSNRDVTCCLSSRSEAFSDRQ